MCRIASLTRSGTPAERGSGTSCCAAWRRPRRGSRGWWRRGTGAGLLTWNGSTAGPAGIPPTFTWETPPGATPPVGGGSSPMTSGDIVDGAVSIYRRGFPVLVLVAAVIQVPLALVGAIVGQELTTAFEPFVELAGREPTQEEFRPVMDEALPTLLSAFVTI